MTKQSSFLKIFILLVLVTASISCNLVSTLNPFPTLEPAVPETPVLSTSNAPAFTYSITESQMNEYAASAIDNNPDAFIQDLEITLPEGLAEIIGQFVQGPLKTEIRLIARPYADAEGNLKIEVVEADLGPIPMGSEMLDTISVYIEDILTSSLEPASMNYRIDSVLITGGVLTLSGQQR